jgi:hypothetical protein
VLLTVKRNVTKILAKNQNASRPGENHLTPKCAVETGVCLVTKNVLIFL